MRFSQEGMSCIMKIIPPKGTKDVTPQESCRWQAAEEIMRKYAAVYGYREIRTPIFEHTELFLRGVGDTTDIVQKEMYTFLDKGERSITLKPEGTASAARAYISDKLIGEAQPIKMYYFTPVFRYENTQAGRLREHHQFGVEAFGAQKASLDAEIIALADSVLKAVGLNNVSLEINSIGCPVCRKRYNEILHEYLSSRADKLCELCNTRIQTNPLRVIDCKNTKCQEQLTDVPLIAQYLCEECAEHFEQVKKNLDILGITYTVNERIVRGLDYYTKTVFEFIGDVGGQTLTLCGGGRYDGLIEQIGGSPTPAAGFGMGMERLLMALGEDTSEQEPVFDVYTASLGDKAEAEACRLTGEMRRAGIKAECDHVGRSLKAQLKYADKIKAPIVLIVGDDEIDNGKIKLKKMNTGEEKECSLDKIIEAVKGELSK